MSLHLGNLSSRLRGDELERVFRRFGRCNVQLKDGFGFVVYDFPTNAEKALRVLRGKNIFGQPLTLSWSNRQPRPLPRFSRGTRSYEMQRGRNSAIGDDNVDRKFVSKGQRDGKNGFKHLDRDGGGHKSADMVDEATRYHQDNGKEFIGEKHHNSGEVLPDEGDNVQSNLIDSDRWGERVVVPSNEIGVEGRLEFDRYEPSHNDVDRRDEDVNQQVPHSATSPTLRKSQDKAERQQMGGVALNLPDVRKSHQTCYICGELGHKMRSCPQENVSQRKKLTRFDSRRAVTNSRHEGEADIERVGSKSHGRLHLSRDAVLMSGHRSYGKASRSREHRRLIRNGNSKVPEETHRGTWRKDYLEKKRSRRENSVPERCAKKARGPVSSPIPSDYTASGSLSHSESSKSVSRSISLSKLRSVSSRTRSPSSRSRSCSTLQYSRPGKSKSRARSRSSSPASLSLSVSIGRPLTSSPNKIQMNQKGSLVDATCLESKEVLAEQAQLVEGDAGSENYKLENMTVPVENKNAIAASQVVKYTEKDHPPWSYDNNNGAVAKVSSEVKNSCTPLSEKGDVNGESLSRQSLGPSKRPVSEALIGEHLPAPAKNPNPESSVNSCTANPRSFSEEELYMVLKHYGLNHPVENEKDLPVEAYFGAARLWPWEIMYYRRLRKGPISTENYARRIAQNQEFGIVDKYIRSSSGWGELGPDNF